jgi:hypothetical protein
MTRDGVCLGILIAWLALMAHAQPAAPIVVLIGSPGSGRTEQASILQRERRMALISARMNSPND